MLISKRSLLNRFLGCVIFFTAVGLYVFYRIGVLLFAEGEDWRKLQTTLQIKNVSKPATRGSILSDDDRVLSTMMPSYILEIDRKAPGIKKEVLEENIDSLSFLLSRKLGGKSASEYKKYLNAIYSGGLSSKRVIRLSNTAVSYADLKEIKRYPFFRLGKNKTGLRAEERVQRDRPFGMLAARTIGDVYPSRGKGGKNGLELAYDSLLRGTPGSVTQSKVGNKWVDLQEIKPENGCDLHTTINVEIQDFAEQALLSKLKEIDAERGVVVLMETKSGEIKAMVNLTRVGEGVYKESRNMAVADQIEPGSTFKTASLIAALESKRINLTDSFYCEKGVWKMGKGYPTLHDANYYKGGNEYLSVERIMWYSSNIGTAKMAIKAFGNNPSEFVDALYKIGLNKPIDIGIPGTGRPFIKHPKENSKIWSGTSLPWMSFGYELQMPPIYTLTFYNAIANHGKMISPLLVKSISKDGEEICRNRSRVLNPRICSEQTLRMVKKTLRGVVTDGTGKPVKSDVVAIAGKTGTALISKGKANYRSLGEEYNVSFCGYFPADNPKYTGIVVIGNPRRGYASGGGMSGAVLRNLAERIVSSERLITKSPSQLPKQNGMKYPILTQKDQDKGLYVMNYLYPELKYFGEYGLINRMKSGFDKMRYTLFGSPRDITPNVIGMCAEDATSMMKRCGYKVSLSGKGKVKKQSVLPGTEVQEGAIVKLLLN